MASKNLDHLSVSHHNPKYRESLKLWPREEEFKTLWHWQPEAFKKGRGKRFFIATAFCGSGKSFLQVCLAIDEIVRSKYSQKQLIIVPQEHIHRGFVADEGLEYQCIKLGNRKYTWDIEDNFCALSTKRVDALKDWLLTAPKKLAKSCSDNHVSGLNAITTHSAMCRAWKGMTTQQRRRAIKNLTLRVDECHHVQNVLLENEAEYGNADLFMTELGRICTYIINSKDEIAHLHITTATFFRSDNSYILSPEVRGKFVEYNLDWVKHYETLGIRDFVLEWEEYNHNQTPASRILSNIRREKDHYHCVTIPSTGHKWREDGDEYLHLLAELEKIFPGQVLDLVTKKNQKKNKQKLLAEPKKYDENNLPKYRVIVMCKLGREGTDWCPCDRLHNASLESAMTLAVQTIGRPFRRYKGKDSIIVRNYVQKFRVPKKGMTKSDLLSDMANALLITMMVDDLVNPVACPLLKPDKKKDGISNTPSPTLKSQLGVVWESAVIAMVNKFEVMENRTKANLILAAEEVCEEFGIDTKKYDVIHGLIACILRRVAPPSLRPLINVEYIRKDHNFAKIMEDAVRSVYFGNIAINDWKVLRNIIEGASWNESFAKLVELKDSCPKEDFPTQRDKDPQKGHLGKWINIQRIAYKKGNLSLERIKKLESIPGWLWSAVNPADEKKKKLLEMSRNGEPRPNIKSTLGMALCWYTNESSNTYDEEFDKEIRKLAPSWFINTADENKKKLLKMARNGEPRPNQKKHLLGRPLSCYTNKLNDCYDEEFDKEIRKLAPSWFINTADENKKKLFKMARNGEPRPSVKNHLLGMALCDYTSKLKGSYDAKFDKEIRKLAPHWFINTADENKKKLLEMARNGESRPYWKKTLAGALVRYTNKSSRSYDAKFDKEIRELSPSWFIDTADENKKKLLEMARNGESRPRREHLLGGVLRSYISKSNRSYDAEFDKKIRQLAPHWFNKTGMKV